MQMVVVAFALGLLVVAVAAAYRLWQRTVGQGEGRPAAVGIDPRRLRGWIDDRRPPLTLEEVVYRAVDRVIRTGERSVSGAILPDTAILRVSVETEQRLRPHWPKVRSELANTLEELAAAEGHDWPDTRFELVGDPLLRLREVHVDLRYADRTVGLSSPALPPVRPRFTPAGQPQHAGGRRPTGARRPHGTPRADDDPTRKPAAVDAQPSWFLRRDDGLSYRLPFGKAVTVGASRACDVVIGSTMVSRTHSRLTADRSGVLIEDLASTNGTFVDGVPVLGQQRLVREGTLRLGPTERLTLVYRIEAGGTP